MIEIDSPFVVRSIERAPGQRYTFFGSLVFRSTRPKERARRRTRHSQRHPKGGREGIISLCLLLAAPRFVHDPPHIFGRNRMTRPGIVCPRERPSFPRARLIFSRDCMDKAGSLRVGGVGTRVPKGGDWHGSIASICATSVALHGRKYLRTFPCYDAFDAQMTVRVIHSLCPCVSFCLLQPTYNLQFSTVAGVESPAAELRMVASEGQSLYELWTCGQRSGPTHGHLAARNDVRRPRSTQTTRPKKFRRAEG